MNRIGTPHQAPPSSPAADDLVLRASPRRLLFYSALALLFVAAGLFLWFLPPLRTGAVRAWLQHGVALLSLLFGVAALLMIGRVGRRTSLTITATEIVSQHEELTIPWRAIRAINIYRRYGGQKSQFVVLQVDDTVLQSRLDHMNSQLGFFGPGTVSLNMSALASDDFRRATEAIAAYARAQNTPPSIIEHD
ncbi:MAG: hypothetical protein KDD73_08075 [Anaerolineales bacterium]|nr:hypothetical protein [Anaerolineales bacterium]MCB9126837.1 hypothetical protein [Ardenticatenales bacterium]